MDTRRFLLRWMYPILRYSGLCHVLIIEDEPFIAMELQLILEDEGATSFAFADTEQEAVDHALSQRPDVITSDVKLASGTGPNAVATIHHALGLIPVIFITATPEACDPCGPPGVVLGKPICTRSVKKAFYNCRQ